MRLAVVIGIRPHFVKLSALYPALKERHAVTVVHTGQHYDYEMSQVFFGQLSLPEPDYHLGVGAGSQAEQTGNALIRIERVIRDLSLDCMLVIGDANTSLAGALAAAKLGIPVGHIEAGARNHDLRMPEEINRVAIDSMASLFLCPTENSASELRQGGVAGNIFFVGDLLLDCVRANLAEVEARSSVLGRLQLTPGDYVVATVHRVDNTDNPRNLGSIVQALVDIEQRVVFSVHPRTEKALQDADLMGILHRAPNVMIVGPQSYMDMLCLTKNARLVVSDSNGLQRETFFIGRPCVILRNSTEYPESVEAGCAALVGADPARIVQAVSQLAQDEPHMYDPSLFGDGHAGKKISLVLAQLALEAG